MSKKIIRKLISAGNETSNRSLFFHSLAAINENRVALSVLDNRRGWEENPDFSPASFEVRFFFTWKFGTNETIKNANCIEHWVEKKSKFSSGDGQ